MKTAAGLLVAICFVPAMIYAQAVAYDYSKLYEQASPAVVQVSTDDGSGSGFLVTKFGHIATNYHVIRNSRYLAVQFPDGRKVKAAVAAVNPHYDMAILKVNSDVVKDIEPLPILPADKESTIKVGIPVVAIGSPLNQKFLMTQGILSKVDENTVLGDFLLQAGNSGGPLMNQEGEVLGILVFRGEPPVEGDRLLSLTLLGGHPRRQAQGPGIVGSVLKPPVRQGAGPVPLAAGIRGTRLPDEIGKQPGFSPEERRPADEDDRRGCRHRQALAFHRRRHPIGAPQPLLSTRPGPLGRMIRV